MRQPFLITGLPRSRTAWLARAAIIEGFSHCCHEPSLAMDCIDDLMRYYVSRSEPFVGVSDSHLAHRLPAIMEIVRPRTLIVLRDLEEVARSLEARGLSSRNCMAALHNIGAVLGNPLVRTIEYEDLSNSGLLAEAFQWLMPGAPLSSLPSKSCKMSKSRPILLGTVKHGP